MPAPRLARTSPDVRTSPYMVLQCGFNLSHPVREETVAKPSDSFSINDRINHFMHGLGTITEINERHTTIQFDASGMKKFLTPMVRLERTDIAAPPPPPKKATRASKA